ncbi:hypothetical protein [Lysinibacillus phage vB_LspM-01]|nr:hypothetical protein [Lysinibacillus phage vB_LspM-01]
MSYKIVNGRAIPTEYEKMEWILRYGSEETILRHRMYLASIVKEYRLLMQKEGSQDEKR